MKKFLKRIEINPDIMVGKPVIAGTRIPVYIILNLLAQGYDIPKLLKAYPALEKEDIQAVLTYAAAHFEGEERHSYV